MTSSLNTTKNSDVSSKIAPVASFRSMFNVSSATSSSASSRLVNSKKDSVSAADLVSQYFPNILYTFSTLCTHFKLIKPFSFLRQPLIRTGI